jgi:hypothetical protein
MEAHRFDWLLRSLTRSRSRRPALRLLVAAALLALPWRTGPANRLQGEEAQEAKENRPALGLAAVIAAPARVPCGTSVRHRVLRDGRVVRGSVHAAVCERGRDVSTGCGRLWRAQRRAQLFAVPWRRPERQLFLLHDPARLQLLWLDRWLHPHG